MFNCTSAVPRPSGSYGCNRSNDFGTSEPMSDNTIWYGTLSFPQTSQAAWLFMPAFADWL
jgi:hypothetical protein